MFTDESGNYKMKVAFDFDETLTEPILFKLAQRFIAQGHDVWILTDRTSDDQYKSHCEKHNLPISSGLRNQDLKEVATQLGLEDKIIFTDADDKLEYYQEHQFDLLFDDDAEWHCNPICEKGGMAISI